MTMAPKDTGGYWRERSISAQAGGGNAKTHLMFSAEWTKSQPLWQRDTAYDNSYYGTASYAGIINSGGSYYMLAPGLNAPTNTTPTTVANLVAQGKISWDGRTDIGLPVGSGTYYTRLECVAPAGAAASDTRTTTATS